jgi:hypothetical protein
MIEVQLGTGETETVDADRWETDGETVTFFKDEQQVASYRSWRSITRRESSDHQELEILPSVPYPVASTRRRRSA